MKYYQDIALLPDAEANLGFIWQKVYQQLHLALVTRQICSGKSAIAISIPEYNDTFFPLGSKLRLFAETQEQLNHLDMAKWLNRLTDYTHHKPIKAVPANITKYACFKRKQFDTNLHRLSRRRAKRKGQSLEQAIEHFSGFKDHETKLPFVNMVSLSTDSIDDFSKKKKFRLFIEKEMVDKHSIGQFSCYGLSSRVTGKHATVPWFD
jgi:CRISPR-associated endonuclease Csy4